MRKLIPILCVILLTSCGGNDEYHFETYGSIADSSIHCDFIYIPDTEGVEDGSSSPDHVPRDAGNNAFDDEIAKKRDELNDLIIKRDTFVKYFGSEAERRNR